MELNQLWVMGTKIEPAWRAEHAYIINIDGEPCCKIASISGLPRIWRQCRKTISMALA